MHNRQQISDVVVRNDPNVICNCPQLAKPTTQMGCECCRTGHEHSQCPYNRVRQQHDALLLALVVKTTPPIRRSRGKGRATKPRWQRRS